MNTFSTCHSDAPLTLTADPGTEKFYQDRAAEYAASTVGTDMSDLVDHFAALLPPGGRVLDAGCGSGRDLKAFKERGFEVIGIDASAEMARLASRHANAFCAPMRIEHLVQEDHFDGIWACASLLHLTASQFPEVLARLTRALVPGGILYVGVKEGRGSFRSPDGRLFHGWNVESLRSTMAKQLQVLEVRRTSDAMPERTDVSWINVWARRRG